MTSLIKLPSSGHSFLRSHDYQEEQESTPSRLEGRKIREATFVRDPVQGTSRQPAEAAHHRQRVAAASPTSLSLLSRSDDIIGCVQVAGVPSFFWQRTARRRSEPIAENFWQVTFGGFVSSANAECGVFEVCDCIFSLLVFLDLSCMLHEHT